MHKAQYWEHHPDNGIKCLLCPHHCIIASGNKGLCRARQNVDGTLYAINYGLTTAMCIDPIEKKPLYHFYPGSSILSMGPNSCNFRCFFCQNHSISQDECATEAISPQELLNYMLEHELYRLAFTYTEPITWYEYILDFAKLSSGYGIEIVLVTNGFINKEPLQALLPYIKAMNIDLKSIDAEFYHKHCGGDLATVMNTIRDAFDAGIHVEVTNLLIPGLNDSNVEVNELVDFIAGISIDIPLHFSAYHPAYQASIKQTSIETVVNACKIGKSVLRYVYAGNLGDVGYTNSYCTGCGVQVIKRDRMSRVISVLIDGKCPECQMPVYGVFDA
ncbi:MAG: AmmeMemoRadiSam system radical SAM enzyme [Candidatus Cloacimonetes bacterium HGW-Cloacimonetes-1]|jgi:pyruvate formate lyase activating enzyme|nr:MAG: AmmeMemoRadiSam system radical SAM enzyme [Candidatus Cloacimonetes bacterium HGW-Cloacimonetes-1]